MWVDLPERNLMIYSHKIMDAKNILKSKLFWLGILNVVIGVLQYVSGSLGDGTAITANGILIIILRFLTSQPVKIK